MPNNINITLELGELTYKEPPKGLTRPPGPPLELEAPPRLADPSYDTRPKKALLDLLRFSRKRSEFKAWLLKAKAKL